MPFEEVQPAPPRAVPRKPKAPVLATLTMIGRPNGRSPAYGLLSIGQEIGRQLHWRADARAAIQIGSGDDAGKVRIVQKDGTLRIRQKRYQKAWSLSLGQIPVLGDKPRPKTPVEIRVVDPLTIEVTLPEWNEAAGDEAMRRVDLAVETVREVMMPRPVRVVPPPPSAPPSIYRKPARPVVAARVAVVSKDGSVSISVEPLMIRIGGNPGVDLNERQAYFLACLVPATDLGFIPTDHIVEKTGYRPEEIRWLACELERPLRSIGLRLGEMPKMGYSLVKESTNAAASAD